MKTLLRYSVSAVCLILAIIFSARAGVAGGAIFFILAVLFEGYFWYLVTRKDKKKS
ncbi:hypothetical protein HR060_15050 [Catenovulum sp. SM1970]|nr:hypothetical protein [Marinifaba aquimaris]